MTTVVLISRNRSDYDVINLDVHLVTTDMHNQFIPIYKFSSFSTHSDWLKSWKPAGCFLKLAMSIKSDFPDVKKVVEAFSVHN